MAGFDFDFLEKLGSGSFGEVYQVLCCNDNKIYALKVIDLEGMGSKVTDVIKEIGFLENVDHPNIVKFYKAFELNPERGRCSQLGIQTELCEMGDMDTFIIKRKGRRFKSQTMHKWMSELSSAVGYLHSKSIMHRDLKPANVFLDKYLNVKLGDFGIAKNVLHSFAGTQIGTCIFMAPETLSGCYYLEADIYSLGCVFLCMATAKDIPLNRGQFHKLPSKLEYGQLKNNIIMSCIEHNKAKRPTAYEVYRKLESDGYNTLCLNKLHSATVSLKRNPFTAYRLNSKDSGIVFSNRPLQPEERFCLKIKAFQDGDDYATFGFIDRDPASLAGAKCPVSVRQLRNVVKCQYQRVKLFKPEPGDRVAFWYHRDGTFKYQCQDKLLVSEDKVKPEENLWAFFVLEFSVIRVKLVDYD